MGAEFIRNRRKTFHREVAEPWNGGWESWWNVTSSAKSVLVIPPELMLFVGTLPMLSWAAASIFLLTCPALAKQAMQTVSNLGAALLLHSVPTNCSQAPRFHQICILYK